MFATVAPIMGAVLMFTSVAGIGVGLFLLYRNARG